LEIIHVTERIRGHVHNWLEDQNFGFIRRPDWKPGSKDDFCHGSALDAAGIRELQKGDEVEYELVRDPRHPERLIVGNLRLVA
jgi:cold shock CspA family protein